MRYDDPNVPVTAVIGIVGAIVFFVLVVVLQAVFLAMQEEELQRKVYSEPDETLSRLRAEQTALLGSYQYVDEASGVVRIPVERAMQLEARADEPGE